MTNEEARQWFLKVYSEIKGQGYVDENEEAYELAIKALEQKPILDKIRAEIEAEITHNLSDEQTQAFAYVLQIIDNVEKDNCKHNCEECEHNDGECCRILFERSFEQEPTSVKHDTFPVKLQINKVYKHISNIDIDELEQEPTIEAYKQVCKERDIAIEQLHELGYEFGQKIESCDDVFDKYGNYKYPCDVELTEPNTATSMSYDDAISRQAEIDDFTAWREKLAYSFSEDYSGVHLLDSAISIIRKMPSVQPKKTGHWIDRVVEECAEYDAIRWKCSECGQLSCCKSKFCGDCGAKMVEPTCDTCKYNTATFMPCNACNNKSLFESQESEDV